jgi:hypothetical protein
VKALETRQHWRAILAVLAILALGSVLVAMGLNLLKNPVRDIDVRNLQAVKLQQPSTRLLLDVEPQRWSALIRNFRSAALTWPSASGEILAELEFRFRDGQTCNVQVLATGREPGRFRIGTLEFIGGDERLLIQILDDERRKLEEPNRFPRSGL